jgi:hypothetical protein
MTPTIRNRDVLISKNQSSKKSSRSVRTMNFIVRKKPIWLMKMTREPMFFVD